MSKPVYRNDEPRRPGRPGRKPKGPRVRIQLVEKDSHGVIQSYTFTVMLPFTHAMKRVQEAFLDIVKERV